MEEFRPFILSAVIGLLVGFERQKAASDNEVALGVRSFLLVGLLGALSGWVSQTAISILVCIFALSLILFSYWLGGKKSIQNSLGVTTELAAGVVFLLGFASNFSYSIPALLGPLVALVLFSKKSLHDFTKKVKVEELQAVLLIILLGVGVINLVPNQFIDPWSLFNPRDYGILVLILALFEFGGYLAAKIFGEKKSSWILGFLGGLASSTAMTVYSARRSQQTNHWLAYAGTVIAAQIASLIQLLIIVYFVSNSLAYALASVVLAAVIVAGISLIITIKYSTEKRDHVEIKSPLDVKNVLRLSLFLGAIIFIFGLAKVFLNESGIQLIAFITGIFELHAISLAVANMYSKNSINNDVAIMSINLAMAASFAAKITMSWILGKRKFAIYLTGTFLLMAAAVFSVNLV